MVLSEQDVLAGMLFQAGHHHVHSYNKMVEVLLPHIVHELSETTMDRTVLKLSGTRFLRPSHSASSCLRSMTTFEAAVVVDCVVTHDGRVVAEEIGTKILSVPVCIGSVLDTGRTDATACRHERPGLFIVSGVEKTFVSQLHARPNHGMVLRSEGGTLVAEIRSVCEKKLRSPSITTIVAVTEKPLLTVEVSLPFMTHRVSLQRAVEATGMPNGMDFLRRRCVRGSEPPGFEEFLDASLLASASRSPNTEVPPHIALTEMLPHDNDATKKVATLARLFRQMCLVCMGAAEIDDRDDLSHKRLDTAGVLLATLIRQILRQHVRSSLLHAHKHILGESGTLSLQTVLGSSRASKALHSAMATGAWRATRTTSSTQAPVVVNSVLRQNMHGVVAVLRRVSHAGLRTESRALKPRMLHSSCWGMLCSVETPESQAAGIVSALCSDAVVRSGDIRDALGRVAKAALAPLQAAAAAERWLEVCVNGTHLLDVCDEEKAVGLLRGLRAAAGLGLDFSICTANASIHLHCDEGAILRPVGVTKDRDRLLSTLAAARGDGPSVPWGGLVFLESCELAGRSVALSYEDATKQGLEYYELLPTTQLSFLAGMIPLLNCNQSPRNVYFTSMIKQAIGVPCTTPGERVEASISAMRRPQRMISPTIIERASETDLDPCYVGVRVATMCFGFNQEDSLILNERSVRNGLGEVLIYRTLKDSVVPRSGAGESQAFERPDGDTTEMKICNYAMVQADGLPAAGTVLHGGDIVFGKTCSMVGASGATVKRCISTVLRSTEGPYLVLSSEQWYDTNTAVFLARVCVVEIRTPGTGDKFASSAGQKGIVGRVVHPTELPYTLDGEVPDMIINPHAIPSRMTVGHLKEGQINELAAAQGRRGNSTPFLSSNSCDSVASELQELGRSPYQTHIMIDPMSGEPYPEPVHMSFMSYIRLKHQAQDKIHARRTGRTVLITRQPSEGRRREGGLRLGEMERDSLGAHGSAHLLKERLTDCSDGTVFSLCNSCGEIGLEGQQNCMVCGSPNVHDKVLPYASKLLVQELAAMHVSFGVHTEEAC